MTDIGDVLRPTIPALSDEIIDAIRQEVPDYARPLDGLFGRNVRRGVEEALLRFVEGEGGDARRRRIYVELGRLEFAEGRSLDALLAAYRVGARVAWRHIVEAGKQADLEPDVLYQLGESIFAYIDGLSAESIEGYAEAQSAAVGERQERRRRLVALLRQQPPAPEAAVRAAAADAGWELPATLAALVTSDERLGRGELAVPLEGGELTLALLAVPRASFGKAAVALGPTVPWTATEASVERARLAWRLLEEGTLPGPVVVADQHLPTLLLHADERLAADLAARVLAPLDELSESSRAKLEPTLRAWLDLQGRVDPVAHELGVHPQTVRYRLGQLRDLFGPLLDEPEGRFALSLALRAG